MPKGPVKTLPSGSLGAIVYAGHGPFHRQGAAASAYMSHSGITATTQAWVH